jgi:hypothetical protein
LRLVRNPPLLCGLPASTLQPVTMGTALRRGRLAVLLTAVLTSFTFALGACGGGGDEQDAEALLDRAFAQAVPSADVDIDAELEIEGLEGFEDPLEISASGPYISAEGTLPKLDMDIEIAGQGAGGALQSGLLSTGRRVFLKFGGSYFEQPAAQVAQANRRLRRNGDGDGGSLSDLGLDPRSWVVDASIEGEEEVGGTKTEHVKGRLDVAAVVNDLNDLVEQSAGAVTGSKDAPQPLKKDDIERLAGSVENPTFDVYVGKDDGIVRRISLRLDLSVPEDDRADVGGVTGASISLAAELSDVGGDQVVRAPRTSSPISVLNSQLGGLAGLASGLTGDGGGAAAPDTETTQPDSGGAGDAEGFERYGQCVEQARPDDVDAIARCAQLVD